MNPFAALALVCTGSFIFAQGHQPLEVPPGQQITQATVLAYVKGKPKSEVVLTGPADLQFIVEHLQGLESRMYDHSIPQVDLTLLISNGQSLRLRVSEIEIGPGAPASAWNRHWFPKDSSLYDFLVSKAYAKQNK